MWSGFKGPLFFQSQQDPIPRVPVTGDPKFQYNPFVVKNHKSHNPDLVNIFVHIFFQSLKEHYFLLEVKQAFISSAATKKVLLLEKGN